MSRPLRIEYPGAWYHVMPRGRRGERIFFNKSDYRNFVDLLKEGSELWKVKVISYCLMPNHFHLLINTPLGNLSRFMRHIDGLYTQTFNRKHKYDGALFRGRFKSILVNGDNYLLQLMRYIHRNPLEARIVKDLDDYQWSSHIGYISKSTTWNWLYKKYIFSILSQDKCISIFQYTNFINQKDSKEVLDLFNKSRWPSFWGGPDFGNWIKEKFYKQKVHKEVPDSVNLAPDMIKIIRIVCEYYGIEEGVLKKIRRGNFNEPRNVAIYLIRILRGDSLGAIGEEFFLSRSSSVSSIFQNMKSLLKKDMSLMMRVEEVKNEIVKSHKRQT